MSFISILISFPFNFSLQNYIYIPTKISHDHSILHELIIRKRIVTTPSKNQSYGNTTPKESLDEVSVNATHECNISSFYKTANWFIKNEFFVKAR